MRSKLVKIECNECKLTTDIVHLILLPDGHNVIGSILSIMTYKYLLVHTTITINH